ncbi:MAG: FAD-dependent oxidoreductase, partial [Bacteroidota bacterium]|nr:FAD-dependent oxidoreductase [Bacteroidota bacterium]
DLGKGLKLGPNAIFLPQNKINYKVNNKNKESFYNSVKNFLPFIELEDLYSDQAGIRPKLTNNNKEFRDFIIVNEEEFGFRNFINLIGIESPGLTASLSIAEYVMKIIL